MIDIFKKLEIEDEKLHPKYLMIRDNLFLTGEISILQDWVTGFEDRDNKIVKEFQTTFHSSFWEFYLFALFKEAKFEIDFSKNRPDFIVKHPTKLYIEAVVANIKEKGAKEDKRSYDDILSMITPHHLQEDFNENMQESITRYSNAIFSSKSKKYDEYANDNNFDKDSPYLIALSGYEQINYGRNFYYAMIALLYGCYYDNLNDKFKKIESILKPGTDSSIPVGMFLNDNQEHISAIIFSCTLTLGKLTSLSISQKKSNLKLNSVLCIRHDCDPPYFKPHLVSPESPEHLSDGVFVFHNPFSKNKLPDNFLNGTNAINVKFEPFTNNFTFSCENLPLVSRINLYDGESFLLNSIEKITKEFNPDIVFVYAKVLSIEKQIDSDSFDVNFQDIQDDHEFEINFNLERFNEHMIEKNKVFFLTFMLERNKEISLSSVEMAKRYHALNKTRCFDLNEGFIIDIKAAERIDS